MKIRYVIADDAAFVRELLKNIIATTGAYFVGEASRGSEVMTVIESTLPDLVLLDMVLPDANGIELVAKIKKVFPDIKVVICSSLDDSQMMKKAFASGADAYITKPFTKHQVLFEIQNLFPTFSEVVNE